MAAPGSKVGVGCLMMSAYVVGLVLVAAECEGQVVAKVHR